MRRKQSGFTLAELLIALALLGVIAAFTIPKLLQSTGNTEASAKVKEAVSTLEQAWYFRKLQGQITAGTLYVNVAQQINSVDTNVGAPPASSGCSNAYPGYIRLANGTLIAGLATGSADVSKTGTTDDNSIICIDTNASATAHSAGQNVFYANFNRAGDFDKGNSNNFTANADNKNFYYGTITVPLFQANGSPYAAGDPFDAPASLKLI